MWCRLELFLPVLDEPTDTVYIISALRPEANEEPWRPPSRDLAVEDRRRGEQRRVLCVVLCSLSGIVAHLVCMRSLWVFYSLQHNLQRGHYVFTLSVPFSVLTSVPCQHQLALVASRAGRSPFLFQHELDVTAAGASNDHGRSSAP